MHDSIAIEDPKRPPRLDATRPLAEAIRGALLEQIRLAEDAAAQVPLSHENRTRVARVRRCRKSIKRARAILRLLRGRVDAGTATGIDTDLRDAARRLSDQRDRDVFTRVLASLLRETKDPHRAEAEMVTVPKARPVGNDETDRAAELVEARMRGLLDRCDALPIDPISWPRLRRHLAARWRRVRGRLRRGLERGGDERLHAVRKDCGRLEAQLMLVEGIGGAAIRRRRRRVGRVYRTIGEDRDLALAAVKLDDDRSALRSAIDRRRNRLIDELGRRIGRIRRYSRRDWSSVAPPKSAKEPPS